MQTFQNTITITRPVGEVFAFLADLRNIPRCSWPRTGGWKTVIWRFSSLRRGMVRVWR